MCPFYPAWMFRGSNACGRIPLLAGIIKLHSGCHKPRGIHDPSEFGRHPWGGGGGFLVPLSLAATGVTVGVDMVSFNRHTQTHCRLLLQDRDRI